MKTKTRVGVIQMSTGSEKETNLRKAGSMIAEAARNEAQVVVLPEYFNYRGKTVEDRLAQAETIPGETSQWAQNLAKKHQIYLLAGSMLEQCSAERAFNTSLLIGPDGDIVAQYRKLHLFDVAIAGQPEYRESATIQSGNDVVVAETKIGKMGLSICYDLRFPELYRALSFLGANIIFVPAAFTLYTGKDHWIVLLRARAIENQAYVIAAGQIGAFDGKSSYGRSVIIDPWGTVIAQASDVEGAIFADLDLEYGTRVREQLPALSHRRDDVFTVGPRTR